MEYKQLGAIADDSVATGAAELLTALKRPPTLCRLTLRRFETLVLDTGGDGEAVLLLHALGCDHRMWLPLLAPLAQRHRVVAPDLRFHASATGAPLAASLDELALDATSVLDALGIGHAIIGGISMGGAVAQHLALLAPRRVSRLWLIATVATGFPAMIERAEAGKRDGIAAQVPPTLARWFTPLALAANGWGVRYARCALASMTPRDWDAAWRALATVSAFERLPELGMPTLLVAGSEDRSIPPASMQSMADRIAGASFELLPGTPHMMSLETPDRLADLLLAHLTSDLL